MFDLRQADLQRVNSLTKYPSIPTYHQLDPKTGRLLPQVVGFSGTVIATEKIDGTNARLIGFPDGSYVLGSREELLYARGDLIGNPALGIVAALRPLADALSWPLRKDAIQVCYFEVYGGKVTGASKQYTSSLQTDFRLFDVAVIADFESLLQRNPAEISSWREGGGQRFLDEVSLRAASDLLGVQLAPRIATVESLPLDVLEASNFLKRHIPETLVALDEQAGMRPEGLVVRSADRSVIAKMRFEDYERTLRR